MATREPTAIGLSHPTVVPANFDPDRLGDATAGRDCGRDPADATGQ